MLFVACVYPHSLGIGKNAFHKRQTEGTVLYDGEAFSLHTREKNNGIANDGFGASNERYSWSQTIHDVTLIIPVPSSTKGKNVDCCIEPNHLRVGLRGTTPVLDVPAVFLHHR